MADDKWQMTDDKRQTPRRLPGSSVICHLSSAICHLPSAICHLPSVICHLSSAICHLSSVICHLSSAEPLHRVAQELLEFGVQEGLAGVAVGKVADPALAAAVAPARGAHDAAVGMA